MLDVAVNGLPTGGSFLSLVSDKFSYSVGDTFVVVTKISSGDVLVGGVDGVITYDSSSLSLVSVEKSQSMVFKNDGDDCVVDKNSSVGQIKFTCFSSDSTKSTAANGELVLLKFRTKKTGDTKIHIECEEGSTYDSNVVGVFGNMDMINCSQNLDLPISVSASNKVTLTPTSNPVGRKVVEGNHIILDLDSNHTSVITD